MTQKGVNSLKIPINELGLPCLQVQLPFLLVVRSDYTTGNRNIKPEVVFKVQKMASFCLIMGPFKGEMPVFARYGPLGLGLGLVLRLGQYGRPS